MHENAPHVCGAFIVRSPFSTPLRILASDEVGQLFRQSGADAGADGELEQHPDGQEDDPGDLQHDADGEQAGGKGTDLEVLVVLDLRHAQGDPDIRGQRREGVGGGVAQTVDQLDEAGVIAEQHQHGHEHRRQDGPLGGAGGHQQVDETGEQDERDDHAEAGEASGHEEVGAGHGHPGS